MSGGIRQKFRKASNDSSRTSAANEGAAYKLVHARQVHYTANISPLTKEAPVQDYRGFHNLVMLLLFVNNLRLVVENYLKYGLLVAIPTSDGFLEDLWRGVAVMIWMPIPLLLMIAGERVAASGLGIARPVKPLKGSSENEVVITASSKSTSAELDNSESWARFRQFTPTTPAWLLILNWICVLAIIGGSNAFCYHYINTPLVSFIPCSWSIILSMKMISYSCVNAELRSAAHAGVQTPEFDASQAFPNNLSISNLAYFLAAPTLCYQASYPRTEKIRYRFAVKRVMELLSIIGMMWFIIKQYTIPTLTNSLRPFETFNFILFERILKLSIPSIYIWLLGFYALFHSYLNFWAEILRFSDRQFYKPWWNASTISQYWRLWNIPVYTWFKRHVYVPFRANHPHSPKWIANMIAFFISAVGHEVIVGVPTHLIHGWAFFGMMAQVPMIWFSDALYSFERKRKRRLSLKGGVVEDPDDMLLRPVNLGNYLFWISFCILGQPLGVLLYYRSYYMREHPDLVPH
eukprot:Partr_v1_DN24941_c0_g1_i1_m45511 putative o-acyltransferase